MHPPPALLVPSDPPPFRVIEGRKGSPFVLGVDHAGRAIPQALGDLGLTPAELDTHIAWDIGILGVSERLARALGACMIAQTYSRLVIDCNRRPDVPTSIVQLSEYTVIPGNRELDADAARARAAAIFYPYHQRFEDELARRERACERTVFVAMHSFTPCFKGHQRRWQCGVLYHRDTRLAQPLLALLRREGLEVGDNEPYFVSEETDYAVLEYGERRGNLHVEIELRQDLIAEPAGQERWAELLARLLPEALATADGR